MNRILIFLCIAASIATTFATNYCDKKLCKDNKKHIGCGNNGLFGKMCPAAREMVKMTDSLKQLIVDGHNAKRNLIAGGFDKYKPACRMATMEWDDELADLAALNVKRCVFQHDKCHNTDRFSSSGQNLAMNALYGAYGVIDDAKFFKSFIDDWFNEYKICHPSYIDSYPTNYPTSAPHIGHFTVMVADRNIRVGCAATTYKPNGEGSIVYLAACNYATTNMLRYAIYETCQTPASGCGGRTNPKYPNLCSTAVQYDLNKWTLPTGIWG